jgi:gluconolactonase
MRGKVIVLLAFLLTAFCSYLKGQETLPLQVIKEGAVLEKLAGDLAFTEGPTADKDGNVYFTDQPNDRIMIWSIDGKLSTFMQPCGRSNGMFFDKKGYLWSCTEAKNEIWRIAPDKSYEIVVGKYNNAVFNGPNDIWVAPDGSIYFTDPFFRRTFWDHTDRPQDKQCLYYLSADRKILKRADDTLVQANGLIGTTDGKTLFVADMGGRKTYSYKINPDGSLTDKKLFCEMGSDGITMDSNGNLYLTGQGVTVFDKTGQKLGNIPVPEKWTANVCFGGKDRKSLFITASTGLYRIAMKYKGIY